METGVRWDVAPSPGLGRPVERRLEGPRGGGQSHGQKVTGLGGGASGVRGHYSLESKGLQLCPEGNVDPLKRFRLLSEAVIHPF